MAKPRGMIRNYLEYGLVRMAGTVLQAMPLPMAQRCGAFLGRVLHRLDKKHRNRVIEQYDMAYQGSPPTPPKEFALLHYEHLGKLIVEILWLPKLIKRKNWKDFLFLEDEVVRKYIDSPIPLIMISGHIGNWEIGGVGSNLEGYRMTSVARPLDNPLLDRYLLSIREMMNQKIIPKKGAIIHLLRLLKNNGKAVFLIDQNAGSDGVFVDFFGRKASTHGIVAALSLRLNIPIAVIFCRRLERGGQFLMSCNELIYPADFKQYDKQEAIQKMTAECTKRLEAVIRRCPEQWLWEHRRWKSRPKTVLSD